MKASPIADTKRADNRGCLSQNGAHWLAKVMREKYPAILRFFYGEDLAVVDLNGAAPVVEPVASSPVRSTPRENSETDFALPALASLGALAMGVVGSSLTGR